MNSRLDTLDAMRGIAAILVVIGHLGLIFPEVHLSAHLAVDFFFVLSGFVIARTYESRLAAGMGFWTFARARLIRLYPLFFLGLMFGLLKAGAEIVVGDDNAYSLPDLIKTTGLELFMLPSPFIPRDGLFPLNGPSWSLFLEMGINLLFGALALRLGLRALLAVIAAAAVGVLLAALSNGSLDAGWAWSTMWAGVARVGFSFTLGVLIHRLGIAEQRGRSLWFLAPVAVLIGMMLIPIAKDARALFEAAAALILSPLVLIAGARMEPPEPLRKACALLGEISYPLYAVHFPLLFIAGFVAQKAGVPPIIWAPVTVVGLVVFALTLSRFYDIPVRAWITARTRARVVAFAAA